LVHLAVELLMGGRRNIRRLALLATALVVAGATVGGALAIEYVGLHQPDEPTETTLFGEEPVGMDRRMQAAMDAGPAVITCNPATGAALVCTEVAGEDVAAARNQGETLYGRSVIAFPKGASADKPPMLNRDSLICAEPVAGAMACLPVTAEVPTVRAGQELLVHYIRQVVEVSGDGSETMYVGELSVPVTVVSE
jgi:fermentation-respiration switch protein FrsA (DUF1100 family)